VTKVFVFVPGLKTKKHYVDSLEERLRSDRRWTPESKLLVFDSGLRIIGGRRIVDAATSLATHLSTVEADEIILMGHSVGGLVIRRAYLQAAGAYEDISAWPWAAAVSRIVLFAVPNRGFGAHVPLLQRALVRFVATPLRLPVVDARAGTAFVTDLRIQWMRTMVSSESDATPYVVQLLGVNDTLVEHQDSLDVEQMRNSGQFGVPDSGHATIIDVRGVRGASVS
jgi:pimeloyl-ACP methyl ester carboxylesterase